MPRRTALAAATLALLTTAALPAGAVPGEPSPLVGRELLQRQEVLDRLADEITAAVPENQRASIPGYAGLTVDPERGRLTVYWHGTVPERVARLVAHPPAGISARVRSAPYALARLRAARDRLVAAAAVGEPGTEWTSVAPAPDGTGLSVTYAPAAGAAAVRTPGGTAERDRVAARAAELAELPVAAVPAVTPQATVTRHSDASPWSAAAELTTPRNGFCSSGFGGWRGKTAVLLTAAHCGTSGTYKTGTGNTIGKASDSDSGLDTTVITLDHGTPSGQFFYGAWNNGQGERRRAVGAGRNNVGDLVCSSGAMTGAHCALKVTQTDYATSIDGVWRTDLDNAARTDDHTITVAQGDSGGVVVASISGGDDMQARGIISAGGGHTVACKWGTDTAASNVTCFDTVVFVPIGPIVTKFGLSLA
ncbi:hypothetical protein [Kitasatospora sp. NPDC058478]|uniref:hypothetical protein n=1 Tax=unclassified Kitasatospora TaxID=2633591 RepID=UPI003652AC2E